MGTGDERGPGRGVAVWTKWPSPPYLKNAVTHACPYIHTRTDGRSAARRMQLSLTLTHGPWPYDTSPPTYPPTHPPATWRCTRRWQHPTREGSCLCFHSPAGCRRGSMRRWLPHHRVPACTGWGCVDRVAAVSAVGWAAPPARPGMHDYYTYDSPSGEPVMCIHVHLSEVHRSVRIRMMYGVAVHST